MERIDRYPDGTLVVRWMRRAEVGEPGYRFDPAGVYLGSLAPAVAGGWVRVDRD